MNEKSEWQFLIDYVKDDTTDFGLDSCRNQLLALWTVYCMHNDLDVDTAMYDAVLLDLFNALSLEQRRELCRNYCVELTTMSPITQICRKMNFKSVVKPLKAALKLALVNSFAILTG